MLNHQRPPKIFKFNMVTFGDMSSNQFADFTINRDNLKPSGLWPSDWIDLMLQPWVWSTPAPNSGLYFISNCKDGEVTVRRNHRI